MDFQDLMKQARAYSGALDQRDEQMRIQTQQRAQTIQSMQTKKYELDERKMGFSQPRMQSISALPTFDAIHPALNQDSPVVQVLQKAMRQEAPAPVSKVTGVNTGLNNQNNPLHSSFQPAMPNDSLLQQATNNFRQWNKQYEQDEDLYIDAVDRVSTLSGMGTSDAEANRRLDESRAKLEQTKTQWNSMMRQTLDMLGTSTEELLKARLKDERDKTSSKEKYQRFLQSNHLRNQLGVDFYDELVEYVRQQENAVQMRNKREAAAKMADEDGVGASLYSIPLRLAGGVAGTLDMLGQGLNRAVSGSHAPLDWNSEWQVPGREASTIRSTVAQNIAEDTGSTKVLPGLYNFGMGMVDSAAAMPINVLTGGWGTALIASAAANDAMQNAKANGASDDQALALGTVTLIAEILTEKMSFDDLDALDVSDMPKLKKALWNNVKSQAKSEGLEEGIAEGVEAVADIVIMGDKSELRRSMQEYENRGYNRDQALARALGEAAGNVVLSSAGGAFSGGLFAAGKTIGGWALTDFGKQKNSPAGADESMNVNADSAIQKADGGTQASNANGPGNTPNASLAYSSPASNSTTADTAVDVNGNHVWQDQGNGSIRYTVEDLERARRAAFARNETERTGILAGATTRQIEQAQRVGRLVGREVLFFSEGQDASGGMQNGYYNTGDGRIYVNTQSGDPAVQVISHELTHSIEKSRFYAKLQQVVLKKIKTDGLDLDTLRAEKQAFYERHGVTDVDADSEIVAEYVAKNLLTDEQSIRSLVMESQTLGQRIMEFIDQLLAMLGNKNAQERELLSKARRYYQKALADSRVQDTTMQQGWLNGDYDPELDVQNGLEGNRYSIGKTTSNKPFVEVEQDILADVPETDWVSTVKENLAQKFPNGITVGNNEINIDKQSRREMTFSRYMQRLYNIDPQLWADKLRATNNADEILQATTDWVNEGLKHPRKDNIREFARGKVLLCVGGNDYTADVVVGTRKNGSMVMYDILDLQPTSFTKKETDAAITVNPSPGVGRNTASISSNSILESPEFGNRKFSISEGENLPELYRAQLRALERLNLAARKEYDGYVEQLNRYKLQLRAKEVIKEYYAAVHENEEAINELKNAYRDWILEQNLNWEEQEDN